MGTGLVFLLGDRADGSLQVTKRSRVHVIELIFDWYTCIQLALGINGRSRRGGIGS